VTRQHTCSRAGKDTLVSAPTRHLDDPAHRHATNEPVGVSALVLARTGLIALRTALVSGLASLLGDASHNLSDVSTSLVVFLGFRFSKRPATPTHPYG
jgi:divalent metal cation (Fe/Co/Zn/Cd) transporter